MFLIEKGGKPKRLPAATFQTEDEFRRLLADFPELLTDADFGEGSPRKWLLVTREAMVPDSQDGSGRWSLDHLFLDQDGVPTLVEIKRASDPRVRREVVAQMLDYAANAARWWKAQDIERWLEERCRREGSTLQLSFLTSSASQSREKSRTGDKSKQISKARHFGSFSLPTRLSES